MAIINHNGKEYEYDPHAVRVAMDCKVCWYSPIVADPPKFQSDPERPVWKGMVVYDGIEKEIKFHLRQPSLDWDAIEGDNWWDSGEYGGFMEYLTQNFLPLNDQYDIDCTIPIDDELDSKCVLKPIIDWTGGHNLVYVPPGTIRVGNPQEDLDEMVYEIEMDEDFEKGTPWEGVEDPSIRVDMIRKWIEEVDDPFPGPTEEHDAYWKVQESNGEDGWGSNALPPIFDLYFSEYKFTCPGWDEDDTLRVIDVLFRPLCHHYLLNEELFENQPYEGDFEEEHIAGWLDLIADMPKASIRILKLLSIEALEAYGRSGLGQDMASMVAIIHETTDNLNVIYPELYAEYFGPAAKEGRYCHWGHSMRNLNIILPDSSDVHVCMECETDFGWNAEFEDGYWHCFDCHLNNEPEFDNHMCSNCGREQGVLNCLEAVVEQNEE